MLYKGILAVVLGAVVCSAEAAFEWKDIVQEKRVGGRMISAGYLKGKVVLLDRRDYSDPANAQAIKRLQAIWATYKTKPFILLGSHNGEGGAKVEAAVKKLGVTYPVYTGAWFEKPEWKPEDAEMMQKVFEDKTPVICVFDSTMRKRLYYGRDDHAAQGVVPSALMAASRPMTAKQFQFLLDWEVENLPGKAYLRLKEFRSQFPKDAASYGAFWEKASGGDEIKRLAKLVELSRLVKDRDASASASQRITPQVLEKTIEKYSDLKQSADPAVAQEAKNALADIKFAASTL